jgi:hypothetical protein
MLSMLLNIALIHNVCALCLRKAAQEKGIQRAARDVVTLKDMLQEQGLTWKQGFAACRSSSLLVRSFLLVHVYRHCGANVPGQLYFGRILGMFSAIHQPQHIHCCCLVCRLLKALTLLSGTMTG